MHEPDRSRQQPSVGVTIAGSAFAAVVAGLLLTNVVAPMLSPRQHAQATTPATPATASRPSTVAAAAPAAATPNPPAAAKPRYLDAAWNDLHFGDAARKATNEQCFACHQEVLSKKVLPASPAGLKSADALAWYQTLDTYGGDQMTFHERHLTSPFARQVMNLKCSFCHQGHDIREEAPGSSATTQNPGAFTLRKVVDPSATCLLCHGKFPAETMGLSGTWEELREGLESAEAPNGCLTCHAEQFRTVRHRVNYLKADAIEAAAKAGSSDVCIGCHGGRAWYRNTYPYARHPWPGMPDEVPDWAKARPKQSKPEHRAEAR